MVLWIASAPTRERQHDLRMVSDRKPAEPWNSTCPASARTLIPCKELACWCVWFSSASTSPAIAQRGFTCKIHKRKAGEHDILGTGGSRAGRARLDAQEKAVESHSEMHIMFVVVTSILWSSEGPP